MEACRPHFQSKMFTLVGNLSWQNFTIRIKNFRIKTTTIPVIPESFIAHFCPERFQ
ncbi:hypothetical protein GBA52_007456 [Prunus armeniaca]|nr:hypothetical protein GBA52_007419 [Prunus armeniaca]KAH0980279.1 hypothetical protein GBA52_007456 [Prunus armeniaca]